MNNLYSQLESMNNVSINNEAAYFGKTKDVLEIEKACGNLIEAAKKDLLGVVNFSDGNLSKVTRDLEEAVEKFVNAGDCYINYDSYSFSTYARLLILPNYTFKDLDGAYDVDKSGLRFKNGKNKKILLNINLAACTGLTAAELTAVLLHEIGHNMNVQRKSVLAMGLSAYFNPFGLLKLVFTVNINNFVLTLLNSSNAEGLNKAIRFVQSMQGAVKALIGYITQILSKVLPISGITSTMAIINALDAGGMTAKKAKELIFSRFISALLGYDGEVYADAFASAYGYAPELASALEKLNMQKLTKSLNKEVFGYKYFSVLNDFASEILGYGFAPHPHRINRISNLANYLNDTAKYTTNPKLKEEVKHQSKELEDMLKSIASDDDEALLDKLEAKGMLEGKEIKSKDFRHLFSQYRNWEKSNLAGSQLLKESLEEYSNDYSLESNSDSLYSKISKML